MYIPLNGRLVCLDGRYGRVQGILIKQSGDFATQLLCRTTWFSLEERLIALRHILGTTTAQVKLNLACSQVANLPTLQNVEVEPLSFASILDWSLVADDVPAFTHPAVKITQRQLPHGVVVARHGLPVYALDGYIGRIHAIEIDKQTYALRQLIISCGFRRQIELSPKYIGSYLANRLQLKIPKRMMV